MKKFLVLLLLCSCDHRGLCIHDCILVCGASGVQSYSEAFCVCVRR